MSEKLFRKKSLDKITSPEKLNEYVKVTNPGVWMLLLGIVVLLIGSIIWGVYGIMESSVSSVAIVEDNQASIYISEENFSKIDKDDYFRINDKEFKISSISDRPICIDESYSDYFLHVGNLAVGQWVYVITGNASLENGIYEAQVVVEKISPMTFILN